MMHDALTYPALGIAQTHDGAGPDLPARNAARIGEGMSLSHDGSPQG